MTSSSCTFPGFDPSRLSGANASGAISFTGLVQPAVSFQQQRAQGCPWILGAQAEENKVSWSLLGKFEVIRGLFIENSITARKAQRQARNLLLTKWKDKAAGTSALSRRRCGGEKAEGGAS